MAIDRIPPGQEKPDRALLQLIEDLAAEAPSVAEEIDELLEEIVEAIALYDIKNTGEFGLYDAEEFKRILYPLRNRLGAIVEWKNRESS